MPGCRGPARLALGWVDAMPELMRAATWSSTTQGGLTAAEALASAVPVVTYRCLPGHGRTNAAALDAEGLVPWIRSRDALAQGLECAAAAGPAVWADPGRAEPDAVFANVLPAMSAVESRTAC